HFFGPSKAAISNHGSITTSAGDVILVGRQIQNSGSISAKNGSVQVAAGDEVVVKPNGTERVLVRPGNAKKVAAQIQASGGNAYALAINNSGAIRATGA